mmetsp:Transcript_23326/g.75209  ORF Transcript_23326/g.75209 Transcript_23326/m.75209 type:complete len:286 (+) Transcript_23326:1692-2549(+)
MPDKLVLHPRGAVRAHAARLHFWQDSRALWRTGLADLRPDRHPRPLLPQDALRLHPGRPSHPPLHRHGQRAHHGQPAWLGPGRFGDDDGDARDPDGRVGRVRRRHRTRSNRLRGGDRRAAHRRGGRRAGRGTRALRDRLAQRLRLARRLLPGCCTRARRDGRRCGPRRLPPLRPRGLLRARDRGGPLRRPSDQRQPAQRRARRRGLRAARVVSGRPAAAAAASRVARPADARAARRRGGGGGAQRARQGDGAEGSGGGAGAGAREGVGRPLLKTFSLHRFHTCEF